VTTASNSMALLLFLLISPVFTFLLRPLFSVYARKNEFEADAYAASHSSARHLVIALVKLYRDNASTLTPDPLHRPFMIHIHPPASASRSWKPPEGEHHAEENFVPCLAMPCRQPRPCRSVRRRRRQDRQADGGQALHLLPRLQLRGDGSGIYTREDHRVKSAKGLIAQIRNCNTNLGLKWFEDEEMHVASYLNKPTTNSTSKAWGVSATGRNSSKPTLPSSVWATS